MELDRSPECVFWFWFKLTPHEYTKSVGAAINDRAGNHAPELRWVIHIDTVWACHACCTWIGQVAICFRQIAMTVLLSVTAGEIRSNSHSSPVFQQMTYPYILALVCRDCLRKTDGQTYQEGNCTPTTQRNDVGTECHVDWGSTVLYVPELQM